MNGRLLTDDQISKALRAYLPDRAQSGLRDRILEATETTGQQRARPSFLGSVSDTDPVGRGRTLLLAAALLLALALASAAAVGAWRLLQRNTLDELSLEPPADVAAFVLSSYERLPQLPPVALTWRDSDSTKGRIYVDRSGAVRFDRFTSAEATEPSTYRILSPDHRISGMANVDSEAVWVEPGHEAIGDDPRVFLRSVLGADDGPGCEIERDPSATGDSTPAAGWRYVGLAYVAGRPTHHVACVGELWIDIETRLILRTQGPAVDESGQPIPVGFTEVTEIAFGEQPAALFEPPAGLAHMSEEEYTAYICPRDLPNELMPGITDCPTRPEAEATPPEPSPTPMPTADPDPSDCGIPSPDPSKPTGPLDWTQARMEQDWPAPVRPEPAGGAGVVPMPRGYVDPTSDTGSDVLPCIDIRKLTVDTYDVFIDLVSNRPPQIEPSQAWIAYGVVVDDDRDGVPDWRYGIDNLPRGAGDQSSHHREWRTNLETGRTEWAVENDFAMYGATGFNSGYPGYPDREGFESGRDGARFRFGHTFDTTQGMQTRGFKVEVPFYGWASAIVDGRVVATDYAPDTGWLLPSPGATPGDVSTGDTPSREPYTPDKPLTGTYLLDDPFPVRLSMTVGDGWTAVAERRFYHAGTVVRDEERTGLRFVMVDNTAKGECASRLHAIDRRATVDDVVAFLAALPLVDISKETDVTVDGHHGRYLEFTRTAGEIDCGWGGLDGWPASSPSARDEADWVWILDIDGHPLVIDAFAPKGSETARAEFQGIVDSISIRP